MKVKLGEIYRTKDSLQKVSELNIPAKIGIRIARLIRKLAEEIQTIDNQRNLLVKKYGEEKDGQIVVKQDKLMDFITEFNDALEQEIEIEGEKIKIPGDVNLDVMSLANFESFIDVED